MPFRGFSTSSAIDPREEGGASLGDRLRRARAARGLSQTAVAALTGLDPSSALGVERGRSYGPCIRERVETLLEELERAPLPFT